MNHNDHAARSTSTSLFLSNPPIAIHHEVEEAHLKTCTNKASRQKVAACAGITNPMTSTTGAPSLFSSHPWLHRCPYDQLTEWGNPGVTGSWIGWPLTLVQTKTELTLGGEQTLQHTGDI